MPKCTLTIELDEPGRAYTGDELVRGHVIVHVDKDVKCNGLIVRSTWETHGKGNVARGTRRELTIFEGEWKSGDVERYPFEIECASWPPTYHGHHLNIDHYISAQADIPWAFDPKTKQPFQVVPPAQPRPADLAATKPAEASVAGKIVGGIVIAILCVVGVLFLLHPCFWIVLVAAGTWWFVTQYMPKQKLGNVEFRVITPKVRRGEHLKAELVLHPRRPVPINSIKYTLNASEVCVRGSGTDRTTYTHKLIDRTEEIVGSGELVGGEPNRFVFEVPIPLDAPLSIDLDDNDIRWSFTAHVDIPKWPDWKKQEKFEVIHSGAETTHHEPLSMPVDSLPVDPTPSNADVTSGVSFEDTCGMVAKVRTDFDQLERVLEAVAGQTMLVSIHIERLISVGTIDPSIGYPDGRAYEGNYDGLPILLFVSTQRQAEVDASVGSTWSGTGMVVGYDQRIGSLQVKAS